MRALSAEELLRLPVRLEGAEVGRSVDLLLDPRQGRAFGLDVLCRDEVHRFLPLAAAQVEGGEVRLDSRLTLVDEPGFDFYRDRASGLRALKGSHVARAGRDLGTLRDVVLTTGGDIEAFVVETDRGTERIPSGPGVLLEEDGRGNGR